MAEETEIKVKLILERSEFENEFSRSTKVVKEEFSNIEDGAKKIRISKKTIASMDEFASSIGKTEREFQQFADGVNQGSKESSDSINNLKSVFQTLLSGLVGFGVFNNFFDTISSGLKNSAKNLSFFATNGKKLFTDFDILFKATSKNFFGFIEVIGQVGIGLVLLGQSLRESENKFLKISGVLTAVVGAALVGTSFLIVKLITDFGKLITTIGNKGVQVFSKAADEFSRFENNAVILNKTIENFNKVTDGAVGSTESWVNLLDGLSNELNLSITSLQKASQEIVSVGSQLGLNEQQLKSLTRITAEYAKVNRKDVFNTSVALVGALNGNAQAVQALGIKLNEASVQQFAYKKGIDKSIRSLSSQEQVQLRFQKLLSQYKNIAGVAAAASGTLAEQQARLENNLKRTNILLGEGSSFIENFNLASFALNKVLSLVPRELFVIAGFVGALGSRVLQVTGLLLTFSFTVFTVIKSIKALNIVLENDIAQSAFSKSIPFLNKSFKDLLVILGASKVNLTSVSGVLSTFGNLIRNNLIGAIIRFSGVTAASAGPLSILSGTIARLGGFALTFSVAVGKVALVLFPIIAIVTSIVSAFKLLSFIFKEIESRTGAFSSSFKVLIDVFSSSASVLKPLFDSFTNFKNTLADLADRTLGFLIQKFAQLTSAAINLAKVNPFGIFNDKQLAKLSDAGHKLNKLSSDIENVGFAFSELDSKVSRSIANTNDSLQTVNLEELARLRDALSDVGKTDLQKLEEERIRRLELLKASLDQELLTKQEYKNLELQVEKDFQSKKRDLEAKEVSDTQKKVKALGQIIKNGLVNLVSGSLQKLGAALVNGGFAFNNFAAFVLNVMGDLAIQIGTTIIASGKAIEALKASLATFSGGIAIAAGAALIVVGGALKALAGNLGGVASSSLASQGVSGVGGGGGLNETLPDDFIQPAELEDRKKEPTITVNVEGNILDNEGTGLELVRILNNAFDKDGVVLNQGVA